MSSQNDYKRMYRNAPVTCTAICCKSEYPIKPPFFSNIPDHRFRFIQTDNNLENWTYVTYKKKKKNNTRRTKSGFNPNLNGLDSV